MSASPAARPWLEPLGLALAECLLRLHRVDPDPLLSELVMALTAALERGELELPLEGPPPEGLTATAWPRGHRQALEHSGLLGTLTDHGAETPLVTTERGVAWRRWQSEMAAVLEEIARRASSPPSEPLDAAARRRVVRAATRRGGLDPLQSRAVGALLEHRLVLLGGGPGTGKTTTVVQMLGAALELQPELRLHLAAPTGKAAARLRQAIGERAGSLPPALAGRLGAVPCTTLHRLLESHGEGFGRHRSRPLALDLLVVDEVSMLDLPLTAALLAALPAEARLLLVGDPAQLPPVGPGPVLIELHRPQRLKALGTAALQLATPYRNEGAIAAVAGRLRQDDGAGLREALQGLGEDDNLRWLRCEPPRLPAELRERLAVHRDRLAELAQQVAVEEPASAEAVLAELESCVLLAPLRQGPWGVETLNRRLLGEAGGLGPGGWPPGTPVLCHRNLPEQGLANGDVGVVVPWQGERRLLFAISGDDGTAGLRWLHPARLAGAEPALALTVHKAQGSQYKEVFVLMGESARWDRRLLYTALTRASRRAVLITPQRPSWLEPPAAAAP